MSVCPSVTFSFPINNSRTPWPTFLKLGPHIRPGQQKNPILGSLDQRSRSPGSNVSKTVSDWLSNNFPKMNIFFIHLCNLFWTDLSSFTKHLCQNKSLGGITFYKHLLFINVIRSRSQRRWSDTHIKSNIGFYVSRLRSQQLISDNLFKRANKSNWFNVIRFRLWKLSTLIQEWHFKNLKPV